ncbi:MAG: MaoC family dehydratase [Anaerolineaceae bacterium]|jgi:3-hydroxybutyryl-CoA dehydratase|nr:MaoC family dehydratase [Anaerolineaceae bacterium]
MLISNEIDKENTIIIGEKSLFSKTISESDINLFSGLVADFHPMHVNAIIAKESRTGKRLAQSALIVGLVNGVLRNHLPGKNFIILRQQVEFLKPVLLGDTVTVKVEVLSWSPEKRLVTMKMDCFNQYGNDILTGETVLIHEPS